MNITHSVFFNPEKVQATVRKVLSLLFSSEPESSYAGFIQHVWSNCNMNYSGPQQLFVNNVLVVFSPRTEISHSDQGPVLTIAPLDSEKIATYHTLLNDSELQIKVEIVKQDLRVTFKRENHMYIISTFDKH